MSLPRIDLRALERARDNAMLRGKALVAAVQSGCIAGHTSANILLAVANSDAKMRKKLFSERIDHKWGLNRGSLSDDREPAYWRDLAYAPRA